jgi:hypothetical protein
MYARAISQPSMVEREMCRTLAETAVGSERETADFIRATRLTAKSAGPTLPCR